MPNEITRVHDYVTVHEGETLSLQRISRTEMGAYLCIATNAVPPSVSKRIIIDVEFSPMIWVPNQLVGAPAGTDVTVDCHTEAHPRAISYWVHGDVMLLPTNKYAIHTGENTYRSHMELTVRDLQADEFGNYRCVSKNSLGETDGSIRLYEIPMPPTSPNPAQMNSNANKQSARTRAFHQMTSPPPAGPGGGAGVTGRPSVLHAQLEHAPERDPAHIYRPHPQHVSDGISVRSWRQPFLIIILTVHMDLII